MSSVSSGAENLTDEASGFNYKYALQIIGIVLACFIVLIFLRYVCNIAIDLCILCSPREARRTIMEFRDRFFPCLRKRRVTPDAGRVAENDQNWPASQNEQAVNATPSNGAVSLDVNGLWEGLSYHSRQSVLDMLLKGKAYQPSDSIPPGCGKCRTANANAVDVENDNSSPLSKSASSCRSLATIGSDSSGCSICLVDFDQSSIVFESTPCQHVFHRLCILEWCKRNNLSCPNCRQPMISQMELEHAIANVTSIV